MAARTNPINVCRPASSSVTQRPVHFSPLMMTVFKILSTLPLWLVHGLGWALGWLAFAGSCAYRRRFLENARQAGIGWRHRIAAVGAGGKQLAELPRLWLGRPVSVCWDGSERVQAALDAGQAVLFLTPHLGCFEVTAQAYARRYGAQQPLTVLFRPPRKAWLRDLVATARSRDGLRVAPTTLGGVKQMVKAMHDGQCLGLLPDQVPPEGLGVWAPFFGRDAYTMTLAVRLARQARVSVLLAWGERLSWGRGYRLHVEPLSEPLPREDAQAAGVINRRMEDLIRRCPQQYLWGYGRYKQPRQEN